MAIDRITITSLPLSPLVDGQPLGTATGFVIQKGVNHYLVTNRHVLTGRYQQTDQPLHPSGAVPNQLNILRHVTGRLGSWRWVRETLYAGATQLWVEHPQLHAAVDVVALPLANTTGVGFYPLDLALRDTAIDLAPASEVSIVGFPLALTAGGGLAIWKSGTIASDVDVNYAGQPVFLIDATTRPSMSGSPVYARRSGSAVRPGGGVDIFVGTRDRFVGVYSGRVHDDAEIGMVWKAHVLFEIYQALP